MAVAGADARLWEVRGYTGKDADETVLTLFESRNSVDRSEGVPYNYAPVTARDTCQHRQDDAEHRFRTTEYGNPRH